MKFTRKKCVLPGRVLNRFSKDVGHMDDLLPITFFDFVQVQYVFCDSVEKVQENGILYERRNISGEHVRETYTP